MATLKEHQAAMVDLLANGSGIPASASRLAHAMHDLINILYVAFPNLPQTKDEDWVNGRETRLTITPDITLDIKDIIRAVEANSPGLNDKALSKPQKALKTDSPAKWPTPAEQRVKELENTIKHLKANNAKLKQERDHLAKCYDGVQNNMIAAYGREQAGCQTLDDHAFPKKEEGVAPCARCGVSEALALEQAGCRKPDVEACEHDWVATLQDDFRTCSKCHREELI